MSKWLCTAVLGTGLVLSGCSSMVTINSEPQGANCYINGQLRGVTPVQTSVTSWALGGNPEIRLEKKGYKPFSGILMKKAQPGYIIVDVLLFWPGLLLNPALVSGEYSYLLERGS